MFLLTITGLILLELIIQPLIHIGGGHVLFLPILMLMAGAYGRWYVWALYLIAFVITSFFISVPLLFFFLLITGSYALSFIFSHLVSETWFRFGIAGLVLTIIVVIPFLLYDRHLSFSVFGSIILNMLILSILFLWERQRI